MTNRQKVWMGLASGGAAIVLVGAFLRPHASPPATAEIVTGRLDIWSMYDGSLEPRDLRVVMSQLAGPATVTDLQPDGHQVTQGEVLVRFDASQIELLRAATVDPYGRTLGYLFLNGRSYSALVVEARLAYESVSHYGDNGFSREAAEVLEAAKGAGPLPFEPPWDFRNRMRDLSRWMKERGVYPKE